MIRCKIFLLATLVAAALAAGATTQVYKDEEVGFRLFPGRDFQYVEKGYRLVSSKYLMAAFQHERGVPTGMGWSYKPVIFCLLIPANQRKVVTGREKEEGESKATAELTEEELNKRWEKQYLSFEELARDQIRGFYFGKPHEMKVAGCDCTLKEMIFEKLQNVRQRWLAATINVQGDQFAIVQTCLEKRFRKDRRDMLRVIKSFRLLDRDKGLTFVEKERPNFVKFEEEGALTAEERKLPLKERNKILLKKAEKVLQKKIDTLPKGWSHLRTPSGNYLVLSQVDAKFTREIARRAEAINAWLEEQFGDIGEGAVPPAVIRIYETEKDLPPEKEARVRLVKSGALVEIVILKRYPWSDPKRGARQVTAEIVDKWFSYRNEDLWDRMPAWMSDGITRFLASADMRGRRLRFQPDVDEKTALNQAFVMDRNLEKKGQPAQNIQPLEKLVRMTRREQWQGAGWSGRFFPYQCGSFVRFLFTGPGARMKQTKGIIQTYVEELTRELEEVQKRIEAERKERAKRRKAMAGMSEEERLKAEDEEYRRRRKEALDSQQKRMLENVYEKTFGRLSDREWQYVQKYWEKFAGK